MGDAARYEIAVREGRLLEARVFGLWSAEEADAYSAALASEVKAHANALVLCADHRPVKVYPPEVTDRLVSLFKQMNSRLERIAILVAPSNATLFLQLERVVRESQFDRRRVLRDAEEGLRHLAPSLSRRELDRARAFLAEWSPEARG
ncbi:MAG: hypothetical protein AB7S26_19400 [Sandaracinaceae bacterium]